MNRLSLRLVVLALVIAVFAVGMTTLLIVFKVEKTHRELHHGRYQLIAGEIDQLAAAGLALGMNIGELASMQQSIARRKSADAAILSIEVAQPDGRVLYATDEPAIGRPAAGWLDYAQKFAAGHRADRRSRNSDGRRADNADRSANAVGAQTGRLYWRWTGGDDAIAGTVIRNSFDEVEGYVALRYAMTEATAMRTQLRADLRPVAIGAGAGLFLFLAALLVLLGGLFERAADRAATWMAAAEDVSGTAGWRGAVAQVRAHLGSASAALASWQANHGSGRQ